MFILVPSWKHVLSPHTENEVTSETWRLGCGRETQPSFAETRPDEFGCRTFMLYVSSNCPETPN